MIQAQIKPFSIPVVRMNGKTIMTIVFTCLAIASVYGRWIWFPLTEDIPGTNLSWYSGDRSYSVGTIFQICILCGGLLLLMRQLVALVFISSGLALLFLAPLESIATDPEWLKTYVTESGDRLELADFMKRVYEPNIDNQPTFVAVTQFESVSDQLEIAVASLGIGWYFALFNTVGLLLILIMRWRMPVNWIPASLIVVGLLVINGYGTVTHLVQAESAREQGDQYLVTGEPRRALHAYATALERNPALGHSFPFLLKVSEVYGLLYGDAHPLSSIAKLGSFAQRPVRRIDSQRAVLKNVRVRLLDAASQHTPSTQLERSLNKLARRMMSDIWVQEGLGEFNENNLHRAANAFQNAISWRDTVPTRFYLATTYIQLGNEHQAINILNVLRQQVTSSIFRANIECTLGDAYTQVGDLENARAAYLECKDHDNSQNYRVVKALSGS